MRGSWEDPPSLDLTSLARLVVGGKEKNWKERRRNVGTLSPSTDWELLVMRGVRERGGGRGARMHAQS